MSSLPARSPMVSADVGESNLSPTVSLQSLSRRNVSVWNRFRRHRLALTGLFVLAFLVITAIAAPVLARQSPYAVNLTSINQSPSSEHWLGTDEAGRDVFSRLLHAGRISLAVGVAVVAVAFVIGMVVGALAGFFGGWVDSSLMRFVDVIISFPTILIVITIISLFGHSLVNLVVAMGLLAWPPIARLLRAEFLSLRQRDFILAAKAVGAPDTRIVLRHLLPNAMAPIIVAATFGVAAAILLEAGLSFLGLGVQIPVASWGNMLSGARNLSVLGSMPWLWVPAGLMIALAVLAINFIGDGLRDALDPHLTHR